MDRKEAERIAVGMAELQILETLREAFAEAGEDTSCIDALNDIVSNGDIYGEVCEEIARAALEAMARATVDQIAKVKQALDLTEPVAEAA